jgi:hypothetical protein
MGTKSEASLFNFMLNHVKMMTSIVQAVPPRQSTPF